MSDYNLVAPINISSPDDWASYSFITGNGSDINPYVIENVEIQGDGVKTREASGHTWLDYLDKGIYIGAVGNFTIRNCRISSISFGIYLDIGVSTDYAHSIQGVKIDNCGIGIYVCGIGWGQITINISKCDISNCNWVTVKAPYDMSSPAYGGFGMWVKGDVGSMIEFCHVQDCSIGIFAGPGVSLISNQLINCGFLFDFGFMLEYSVIFKNTINGKPLGLFVLENNLIMSGSEASLYGQLIFVGCRNLHLSNLNIKKSCSFGLLLEHCWYANLQNIVCENQKIGFFITSDHITADNLYAISCDAGFCILTYGSILNRLLTDNTDVPIYTYQPIFNVSIGIEKSTRFYIIDHSTVDEIQINSSVSSIMVPRSNMSEFDSKGFIIQLDEIDTYHITGFQPIPQILLYNFTIVIFERSEALTIPGFPLICFYTAILLGISFLILLMRYKKR